MKTINYQPELSTIFPITLKLSPCDLCQYSEYVIILQKERKNQIKLKKSINCSERLMSNLLTLYFLTIKIYMNKCTSFQQK